MTRMTWLAGLFLPVLLLGCAARMSGPEINTEATADKATQVASALGFRTGLMGTLAAMPPLDDGVMQWEYRGRSDADGLEVLMAFRPIRDMEIDYQDPHGSAPDPNHIFKLVYDRLLETYAVNAVSFDRAYPEQVAQERFNADWAGAGIFDLRPELAQGYREGMLLLFHKNRVADVYVLIRFNDAEKARDALARTVAALGFTRSEVSQRVDEEVPLPGG